MRIRATPVSDSQGATLADEVIAALSEHVADTVPGGQPLLTET
jgi:hypothetical protein